MTTLYEINTRNRRERMKRFWLCYVEGTDGGIHYKHFSLELAQQEVERLAKLTGRTVYIFECIGKCKMEEAPIKWEVPRDKYAD